MGPFSQNRLANDQVNVLTNARVKEVLSDRIVFSQKEEDGRVANKELPMGFCLWSTGVCEYICNRLRKVAVLSVRCRL